MQMRKKYRAPHFDKLYSSWLSSFGKPASSSDKQRPVRADFSTYAVRA
jgi:hypothetical protein